MRKLLSKRINYISYETQLERAVYNCLESIRFPYSKGVELRLFSNQPTELPVEKVYDRSQDDPSFSILDLAKCLNPPVEHNCDGAISIVLSSALTKSWVNGNFHHWEVWRAFIVDKDDTNTDKSLVSQQEVVVKFFDPVYHSPDYLNLHKRFLQAYKSYYYETQAYEIGKSAQGIYIPQFYGSYIFNVPSQGRSVCAIVEEYIPGYSLDQLNPEKFCRDMKFQIICRVLQSADFLQSLGLFLCDNNPRNVVLRHFDRHEYPGGGSIDDMNCVGDLSGRCSKCCHESRIPEIRLIDFEVISLYLSRMGRTLEDLARTVNGIRDGELEEASSSEEYAVDYAGELWEFRTSGWMEERYLKVIQYVRLASDTENGRKIRCY